MRKIFLLLICYLFMQPAFSQTFGGGFLAGLSMSQLDGDTWGGFHKAGFTGGIYTYTTITNKFDVQLELRYVQKGSQSNSKDPEVFYRSTLNYIELPLFLRYNVYSKFSADIGLAFGFLQKSAEDKDGSGDLPADPPFNKTEFSGLIGVNYKMLDWLNFNARYNYSILAVRDHPGGQSWFLNQGQYNSVITIALYFQLANFGTK
jgi:hypothetical protein